MTYILLGIFALGLSGYVLLWWSDHGCGLGRSLAGLLGVFAIIGTALGAAAYVALVWQWIGADYRASIINREYGTKYTREEVFYASDVIDTIRELDRKRIELNGDVVTGEDNGDS